MTPNRRNTLALLCPTLPPRPLPRRHLQLLVREHEILCGLRLVAVEAAGQVGVGVGGLVGAEGLVFPLAVALRLGVFGAPAGALLHHGVAEDVCRLVEA